MGFVVKIQHFHLNTTSSITHFVPQCYIMKHYASSESNSP